jgi:DNA-binding IscR family transcriptional regulator
MRQKALIALKCLGIMAREQRTMHSDELSKVAAMPPMFTRKVLQDLTHFGILKSMRGPAGGFSLIRPAATIADVMTACGEDPADLSYVGAEAFGAALLYRRNTTMADLAKKARGRGVAA